MLVLGVLKLRSTYILHPHWCFYSFQPFMGFSFEGMYWDRYLFCFIRIFWDFTVRNHDVLLDYMGTPWRNFTLQIFMIKILICLYIIARNNATCYFLWLWCVPEKKNSFRQTLEKYARWHNRSVISKFKILKGLKGFKKWDICRSSHNGVVRNFTKFTGKHLCQGLRPST